MTTIKLASYQNGPNSVEIYSDGTKVRYWRGENEFPDHADVKITDWCDAGCSFCHEKSTRKGKHGDLDLVLEMWRDLPAGCELAVGGGDALSHPDLIPFLQENKRRGHISNITINELHFQTRRPIIEKLISEDLVKGIGVSLRNIDEFFKGFFFDKYPHLIVHVITGVHSFHDFYRLKDKFSKFLILGYKEFGFGLKKAASVETKKQTWRRNLSRLLTSGNLISFDNLALKQLKVRDYFSEEQWKEKYMGDDGQFSLYVDAVEKKYGLNSCAEKRFPISGDVKKCFKNLLTYRESVIN